MQRFDMTKKCPHCGWIFDPTNSLVPEHYFPGPFERCPGSQKNPRKTDRRPLWKDQQELTPEQAQAAYDAAPAVPLNKERIQEIVTSAVEGAGPQTHEEARQCHEGFLAGATAYARAVGHSTLKRDNPKLCEVFDAQGWKTIELFEKLGLEEME